jgi:DNA mismatch repair protein MutS
VVHRAWEVLEELEAASQRRATDGARRGKRVEGEQMPLFPLREPLLQELLSLDVANMTPLEAINKLYELQIKAKES